MFEQLASPEEIKKASLNAPPPPVASADLSFLLHKREDLTFTTTPIPFSIAHKNLYDGYLGQPKFAFHGKVYNQHLTAIGIV